MKQLAKRGDRIGLADLFVTVNREIAEVLYDSRFGEKRRSDRVAKCRLINERAQTLAVRKLKVASLL